MTPTLILYNGNLHTLWQQAPRATALAIRDGRILAVGDDATVRALSGVGTEEMDLEGHFAMPGLTDSHIHFYAWAQSRHELDLAGTRSLDEFQARVRDRLGSLEHGRWLTGRGWSETEWEPPVMPRREDLDALSTGHPMIFWRADMHGAVANSAALELGGVTRDTPDPDGGVIERDASGEPTGRLFEMAIKLVAEKIPVLDEESTAAAVLAAIRDCHRLGLTGLHDQRMKGHGEGGPALRCYGRLHSMDHLRLRLTTNVDSEQRAEVWALGLHSGLGDHRLQLGHMKIFVDGSLGSQTAWMLEPFENTTDNFGVVVTPVEEIHEIVRDAQRKGWAISVHAIGDRANREMLDIFEELARERDPRVRLPHRIEHVQTIQDEDIPRLRKFGIVASVQPIHLADDMIAVDRLWGARGRNSYPFRRLLDSGATLAFGSDCPVADPNPFYGIHAAVTRRRRNGHPEGGWYPEEALTVEEAIYAYTAGAARAVGKQHVLGRLAPGYLADIVVLDRDLLAIDPGEIPETQVKAVIFDGEIQAL